jgi:hypothetical protein
VNYPTLNEPVFKDASSTYFINAGVATVIDGKIYETVGTSSILRYPLPSQQVIIDGVYVKSNHFKFWKEVSPYLPQGCFISHGYVSPENQARIGLSLYEKAYNKLILSEFVAVEGSEPNPELIGKYKDIYLFQVDYSKIKYFLNSKGINWALPNTTVHQRGLALDITFKKEYYGTFVNVLKWFYLNNKQELNLSGVFIQQSENVMHIEFVEVGSNVTNFIGDSFFMVNGVNSPVSKFLNGKESRFYEIMKSNGHLDLADTAYNKNLLAAMPNSAKRHNSALAKAIKEILDDALGGPGGIISTLVQSQLDYSQSLINGLLGAMSVVSDELDTLTEGRASILIKEAIESEIEKTSDNILIKNKALDLTPLTIDDSDILMIKEAVSTSNNKLDIRKKRIKKSEANRSISKIDPKKTPDNTEPVYDSIRKTDGNIQISNLAFDHFSDINTNFVINLEQNVTGKYTTTVNNIKQQLISHNLNNINVKAYAKDLKGILVTFHQNSIDSNNINIEFNTPFSGTIEVY